MAEARSLTGWLPYILGGLVIGLLWARPDLLSELRESQMLSAQAQPDCSIAEEPCPVVFDDGLTLTVHVSPRGMPPATPLEFVVTSSDPAALPQRVEIQGLTMAMGLTRVPLRADGPGRWVGEGSLPICTVDSMQWRADLLLELDGAPRQASYEFWSSGREPLAPAAPQPALDPSYGDFTLQTGEGDLALSSLRGKVVVLYFGYTACPDICPTTLSAMGAAFQDLSPDELERTAGLFVSVDPERDRPENLGAYGAYFHPAILAGTQELDQVTATAADWGVSFRKVETPGSAMGYSVDHSTSAFLVGADGRFVRELAHGTPPGEIAAAIREALR